jgi:hypothetical protein
MPNLIGAELRVRYPEGFCPHSVEICLKCGKFKGWGSHGRLTVIPDNCKRQVEHMMRIKEMILGNGQ